MAWPEWTFHQVCQHCSRLQPRQNKIFQLWWMRWIFRHFQTALLSSQALLHFIVRNFLWRELDTTWFCHALVSAISSALGNSFVPIICQCNNTTAAATLQPVSGSICWSYMLHAEQPVLTRLYCLDDTWLECKTVWNALLHDLREISTMNCINNDPKKGLGQKPKLQLVF